jgi:hypothetical protein
VSPAVKFRTSVEIRNYWEKRRKEIDAERASNTSNLTSGGTPKIKTKGRNDPSPWVKWADLEQALEDVDALLELLSEYQAQLTETENRMDKMEKDHQKEILRKHKQLSGGF